LKKTVFHVIFLLFAVLLVSCSQKSDTFVFLYEESSGYRAFVTYTQITPQTDIPFKLDMVFTKSDNVEHTVIFPDEFKGMTFTGAEDEMNVSFGDDDIIVSSENQSILYLIPSFIEAAYINSGDINAADEAYIYDGIYDNISFTITFDETMTYPICIKCADGDSVSLIEFDNFEYIADKQ